MVDYKGHDVHDTQEKINRAFANLAPVILWESGSDRRCTFLNKKWFEYTGQDPDLAMGDGWIEPVHPDDRAFLYESLGKCYQSHSPFQFEYRLRRFDGSYRWHLDQSRPKFNMDGTFDGFVGSITDIDDKKRSEEALRNSQRKLHVATGAAEMGIFEWDPVSGATLWENEKMFEIFGVRENNDYSKPRFLEGYLHPEDINRFRAGLIAGTYQTPVFHVECRILPEGSREYQWIECFGRFEFENAKPVRLVGVVKNITGRRLMEEELKHEKELLQTILDSIPVMITIYNPAIKVTYLNKAVAAITGWGNEDHLKSDIMELAYPDPAYREMVNEYMASLAPGFRDLKMTTKSGNTVQVSWANIRISDGTNVGIGIDITERHEYEKRVSQLSQKLQIVIENIVDGVIIYGSDRQIMIANRAAKQIFDYITSSKDFKSQDFQLYNKTGRLIPEAKWPRNKVLGGKHFIKEEYRTYNRATGKEAYLEYTGIPIMENGRLVVAIITIRDITKRKNTQLKIKKANEELKSKNDKLQRINQLHENLLYIIAHDLKNPIGNMSLISDFLQEAHSDLDRRQWLEKMRILIDRQQGIISGIVELLEAESQAGLTVSRINLKSFTRELVQENEADLVRCGGRVTYHFKEAQNLYFNKSLLSSIMRNLISNAVKYRKETENLAIDFTSEKKGSFVVIHVSDNGTGIDLEKYGKDMFKPFRRFTTRSKGTGMGLYLIRMLIERDGGRIEALSKPGVGTTFSCYFKQGRGD